jgi:thiamine biosynthesis lipoprotein
MRHRTQNNESLRVGLENPFQTSQAIGVVTLGNKSLCGSSGNRRSWEDFHHILNPHTLRSPKHISALWTVADSTLLADALSTCLFFVPAQKLLKHFRFEYLLLYPDYSIEKSAHFPAELFYQQ